MQELLHSRRIRLTLKATRSSRSFGFESKANLAGIVTKPSEFQIRREVRDFHAMNLFRSWLCRQCPAKLPFANDGVRYTGAVNGEHSRRRAESMKMTE
jgi:hypothetical protein